jgi:hypothetical protein
MNEKVKNNFQEFKQIVESNKVLKTAVYIGIGVLSLYLLGKVFKGLASTVQGFNELKSAINGK